VRWGRRRVRSRGKRVRAWATPSPRHPTAPTSARSSNPTSDASARRPRGARRGRRTHG
jgi:hypothetical protein